MSEYILLPARDFNKIGMSRHRFEQLWSYVWWSNQYFHHQEYMSHAKHHWQLVQYFVDCFNDQRSENVFPSDILYEDESISAWNLKNGAIVDGKSYVVSL